MIVTDIKGGFRMISPTYEDFLALKDYLVVRTNGTIHFKCGANKFPTKRFARMQPERAISWKEFQLYYADIVYMMAGYNPSQQAIPEDY